MSEIYKGIKYKGIRLSGDISDVPILKTLKHWCGIFSANNFAPPYPGGSSGNLSFRTRRRKNEFIITASFTTLGNKMTNNDFAEVVNCLPDENTIYFNGLKNPSSESFLHYYIYRNRPDINAVFHGHSEDILIIAKKTGIAETEKEIEYGTLELAESILPLALHHNFFIMKNHGFISIAKSMNQAGNQLLRLSSNTKLLSKR
jgi:ribulose-5-phosphate 4-epimerase/fuculose-1-phosphate aldolase